jgi:hypothetical protein
MNDFAHKKVAEIALSASKKFTDAQKQRIIEAAILPDKDEADGAFVHHFYNPVTRLNYQSGEDSALNRALYHAAKAIIYSPNSLCPIEFGRALHFLTDIATPCHTGYEDAIIDPWFRAEAHLELEREIDKFAVRLKSANNLLTKPEFVDIYDCCHETAIKSSVLYWKYLSGGILLKDCAEESFKNAIVAASSLIDCFSKYEVFENGYSYVLHYFDDYYYVPKSEKYRVLDSYDGVLVYEKPKIGMNYRFLRILDNIGAGSPSFYKNLRR